MLKKNWFIIVGSIVMLIVITVVIAEMVNPSKKCNASCHQSKACLSEVADVDCDTTASCKKDVCQSGNKKKNCQEND